MESNIKTLESRSTLSGIKNYFSLVKFAHTIFAMPFALIGFFYGLKTINYQLSRPWWMLFILVILCMVFARSAAMAFNRWLDADYDAKNPRTVIREIPGGIISKRNAMIFVVINCLAFIVTTYFINVMCLALSPVALFVILFYSYTKRFTPLCHLVLGTWFKPCTYRRLYCGYRPICFGAGIVFFLGFILGKRFRYHLCIAG